MTGTITGMSNPTRAPDAIPPRRAAGYALGNVGLACFLVTPQLLLLYFLTDTLAVPAATAGIVVMVPKMWEVVLDPLIGAVSDRLRGRLGRRWPLMALGALFFPLGFAAMFIPPPGWSMTATLVWVMLAYIGTSTAYALFSIPYATTAAEVSSDQAVRNRLVAWRVGLLCIGLLVASGLSPLLLHLGGGGRHGYAVMGISVGAIAGGALLGSLRANWLLQNRTAERLRPPSMRQSFRTGLRATLGNRGYRLLWTGYACQTLAMGAQFALMPYAVRYQLHATTDVITDLAVVATIVQILAMPLWVRVADRIGTARAAAVAAFAYGAAALGYLLCGPGDVAPAVIVAALSGLGQAGCYMLPFALMPTVVAGVDAEDAARNAGFLTAIWVSGEKLGLAFGGAAAGLMLGIVGYASGQDSQPAAVLHAVPILFAGIPALLLATGGILLLMLGRSVRAES
jgi:Na+/melibiose symporter-like transporter